MHEAEQDIRGLQALIETSMSEAGPHLRRIFRPPQHTVSAAQVARMFRGKKQIALATVTARGEPRVAPVDAILLRAKFHFGTSERSARVRHLRARPALSLTHFEADDLAIIVHGRAALIEFADPDFRPVEDEFLAVYGGTPSTEEEGSVYVRVDPTAVYTFARDPSRLPK
jgi:hypothetical protein